LGAVALGVGAGLLVVRRAFGGPSRGGLMDPVAAEQKKQRDKIMFTSLRQRLASEGLVPRTDAFWRAEERKLFSGEQMVSGIDFKKYSKVKVEVKGGLGEESRAKLSRRPARTSTCPKNYRTTLSAAAMTLRLQCSNTPCQPCCWART